MSHWFLSLFLAFSFLTPVFAAVPEGTLEESAPATKPLVGLDLYGWTYSNAFAKWDGRTPKSDGLGSSPIQIVTQLTAHTPAFGGFDFEITPQFAFQPLEGERFQLLDPTAGFQGVVAEAGDFSYWARFETALPLLEKSRLAGMVTSPQAINVFGYKIAGTPLKAELVLIPSVNFKNSGTSGFLYVSPRLYYSLSDSFWIISVVQLGYESQKGMFNYQAAGPASVGLGMRYLSGGGKGLWVQPFANFYANDTAATTAHLGVNFGGPLL